MTMKYANYFLLPMALLGLLKTEVLRADPAYISVESLTTQVPASSGASFVKLDMIDESKDIELAPSKDKVIVKKDGLYYISVAGQIGAAEKGAQGYMDVWLVRNGQPMPNSNNRMAISKDAPMSVLTTTSLITLSAGDTIATGFSASAPSLGFIFVQPDNEPAVTAFTFFMFKVN